jgi:hypothetical protein
MLLSFHDPLRTGIISVLTFALPGENQEKAYEVVRWIVRPELDYLLW